MADEEKKEEASAESKADKPAEKPVEEAKAEETEEVEVPEKFKALVESIEQLTALELSELVKILEDKFGVSAAAPMMMAGGAAAGGDAGAAETKDDYNVELVEAGSNKISVIKVVREITGKGLKEAKDMVDAAPSIIKENAPTKEAEEIKAKIEEAGGKVNLK